MKLENFISGRFSETSPTEWIFFNFIWWFGKFWQNTEGGDSPIAVPGSATILYTYNFSYDWLITPNFVRNHLPQMVLIVNSIKHPLTCVLGQMCSERGQQDATAINIVTYTIYRKQFSAEDYFQIDILKWFLLFSNLLNEQTSNIQQVFLLILSFCSFSNCFSIRLLSFFYLPWIYNISLFELNYRIHKTMIFNQINFLQNNLEIFIFLNFW